jgi:hypothetical protein
VTGVPLAFSIIGDDQLFTALENYAYVSRPDRDWSAVHPGGEVCVGKVEQDRVSAALGDHHPGRQFTMPVDASLIHQKGNQRDRLVVGGIPAQIEGVALADTIFDQSGLRSKGTACIPHKGIVTLILKRPSTDFPFLRQGQKGMQTLHPKRRRSSQARNL